MACSLFSLLSLLSLLSLMGLSLQTEPYLLLSHNGPTHPVGSPTSLRCQIVNLTPDASFTVYFVRDGEDIYQISSAFSYSEPTWYIAGQTVGHPLDLADLTHTSPVIFPFYEVAFKQTSLGSHDFACRLVATLANQKDTLRLESGPLTIASTEAPPVFSTNLTSEVLLGQPFTATCTFSNVTLPSLDPYTVSFYSSLAGRLASFEVTDGQTLLNILSDEEFDGTHVAPGRREAYPIFDLVLTEKRNLNLRYWCSHEEKGDEKMIESNVWSGGVHFTSSRPGLDKQNGTCAVDGAGVGVRGVAYSVQFLTDLGPEAENLLAEYTAEANHPGVFRKHTFQPWGSIHHGPSTTWPTFSVGANIYSSSPFNATWWCVLSLGKSGSAEYRQIKSNKVAL